MIERASTGLGILPYEQKPYSLDYRIVLPDGHERIMHEQAEVVYDAAGRRTRIIGTVQDITERKQAEEAMRVAKEAAGCHPY